MPHAARGAINDDATCGKRGTSKTARDDVCHVRLETRIDIDDNDERRCSRWWRTVWKSHDVEDVQMFVSMYGTDQSKETNQIWELISKSGRVSPGQV